VRRPNTTKCYVREESGGELVEGDSSPLLLGSLEAKSSIFVIIITTTIVHIFVILNFELDSYSYSLDPSFSIHRFRMMLFASMCE
jgi:hypothetical protein